MNKATLIGGIISLIPYALFGLAGCGGGDGGYVPPPPPPAVAYTVGGMVSGLVGSGLVLANGSDSLAISADGAFTLATKIAMGTGYNVTVGTQPTNPSQTCGVTNGSGSMGSVNVTNVSVVCTTTSLSNARLAGNYKVVNFEYPSPFDYGGDFSDLLTLAFDGAGYFSGTDVQNADGTIVSSATSGTYEVATDGILTIGWAGGSTITGGLSADGNTLVASQTTSGNSPRFLFGIKQGQSNFSNANLTGTYTAIHYDPLNAGDSSGLSTVTFDGVGNFSGTDTLNNAGTVSSMAVSGTYTVATDGTLTISRAGGPTITGGLSADGNTLVTSQTTSGDSPSVLFGIKQGQTNFSNANLIGTYTAVHYDNHSGGDSSGLSTVTFDGVGNFSGTDTLNNAGTVSSVAVSGTYTVAADGTLAIGSVTLPTVTGALSADGNTLVASKTTSGLPPTVLIGVQSSKVSLIPDSISVVCQETAASSRHYYLCPNSLAATLKNIGTSPLYVFGISIGQGAAEFSQTNNCAVSLSPGQTCAITVRYIGPTSISSLNFLHDTTYTGTLLVEESVFATPETAITLEVSLTVVLPKAG